MAKIWIFISLFLPFWAWGQENKIEPVTAYSTVDELRIRAEPRLQSKVLGSLKEQEKITILAISTEKISINLRGKAINAPWYKIRTFQQNEGWVFGGGITLSSPPPLEFASVIQTSYEGYTIRIDSLTKVELKNDHFGDNNSDVTYLGYTFDFQKYDSVLNYYLFDCWIYTAYCAEQNSLVLVNAKTGHIEHIPTGYTNHLHFSPNRKNVFVAYYTEIGSTNWIGIWEIGTDSVKNILNKQGKVFTNLSKKYSHTITRAEWLNDTEIRFYVGTPTEERYFTYKIGEVFPLIESD